MHPDIPRRHELRACLWLAVLVTVLHPASALASLFHGETLDAIANGISWVAIVIAPIIGIAIFWLVHILPEKIAEKKKLYKYATYETILKRDGVVADESK